VGGDERPYNIYRVGLFWVGGVGRRGGACRNFIGGWGVLVWLFGVFRKGMECEVDGDRVVLSRVARVGDTYQYLSCCTDLSGGLATWL